MSPLFTVWQSGLATSPHVTMIHMICLVTWVVPILFRQISTCHSGGFTSDTQRRAIHNFTLSSLLFLHGNCKELVVKVIRKL